MIWELQEGSKFTKLIVTKQNVYMNEENVNTYKLMSHQQ